MHISSESLTEGCAASIWNLGSLKQTTTYNYEYKFAYSDQISLTVDIC